MSRSNQMSGTCHIKRMSHVIYQMYMPYEEQVQRVRRNSKSWRKTHQQRMPSCTLRHTCCVTIVSHAAPCVTHHTHVASHVAPYLASHMVHHTHVACYTTRPSYTNILSYTHKKYHTLYTHDALYTHDVLHTHDALYTHDRLVAIHTPWPLHTSFRT